MVSVENLFFDGNYQRYLDFEGKTTFSLFIYKTTILKEFGGIRGCCISKEQWGWGKGLRPTLARGGWRGGLRPTLAREGWRGNLRPTLARGGWRESPRPTLAILRASGELSPGRKSARRWLHPPKSCGFRRSRHCRASRINDFGRFSRASGSKWARGEICPTLASLRASGRNLPGRKSARRPKSTRMVSNIRLPNFQLLVEPNTRREISPTTTMYRM